MDLLHIALQYPSEEKADIFFNKILGLKSKKQFKITSNLSEQLFGINKNIRVKLFSNNGICFEIFITGIKMEQKKRYDHFCLMVNDKKNLVAKCKKYRTRIYIIKKDKKEFMFIKDNVGYLYEIKEPSRS